MALTSTTWGSAKDHLSLTAWLDGWTWTWSYLLDVSWSPPQACFQSCLWPWLPLLPTRLPEWSLDLGHHFPSQGLSKDTATALCAGFSPCGMVPAQPWLPDCFPLYHNNNNKKKNAIDLSTKDDTNTKCLWTRHWIILKNPWIMLRLLAAHTN